MTFSWHSKHIPTHQWDQAHPPPTLIRICLHYFWRPNSWNLAGEVGRFWVCLGTWYVIGMFVSNFFSFWKRFSGVIGADSQINWISYKLYVFTVFLTNISKSNGRVWEAVFKSRFLMLLRSDFAYSKSIVEHDLSTFTSWNISMKPLKSQGAS